MLSSSFDMDIIHATSGAVYAIICSHEVPSAAMSLCITESQFHGGHVIENGEHLIEKGGHLYACHSQ